MNKTNSEHGDQEKMLAWIYTQRGQAAEVLKLDGSCDRPQTNSLLSHEIIVKVNFVSLYAPNLQLMAALPYIGKKPKIPEYEFSGEVVSLGSPNETRSGHLQVGDYVYGMINPKKPGYNGVLAEYIVVPATYVIKNPPSISMESASGLTGPSCTCIGIAERAGLLQVVTQNNNPTVQGKAQGQRVLVTGGSTATGQAMLQLAKMLVGANGKIITTASPRNTDLVQKLGADHVIDYTAQPDLHSYLASNFSSEDTMFDAIFDFSGTDSLLYLKSPAYLKKDGVFVFVGAISTSHKRVEEGLQGSVSFLLMLVAQVLGWLLASFTPTILGGTPRRCFFHSGTPTYRNLQLANYLVEQGHLNVVVDSVWKMAELLEAYDYLSAGKMTGKVVVDVQAR